jgi:hypothetical protein
MCLKKCGMTLMRFNRRFYKYCFVSARKDGDVCQFFCSLMKILFIRMNKKNVEIIDYEKKY